MNKSTFDGVIRATASTTHPLQTNLEFVFTDFLPNKNKQGVQADEIANLIRTGLDQPVKAAFHHGKIGDHIFSVPVGHITEMEPRTDQVIGRAILYKDEFPDLIAHLETASASDAGVHFSWELYHADTQIDDAGISWLKDCVVAGVTIVANPAYAGRTPLLAMASTDKLEELEQQVDALQAQLNGGIESMDPVEQLKQQLADLTARVTEVESHATVADTTADIAPDVAALTSELEELRTFKSTVEKDQARAAILSTRREALKDTLSAEDFDKKADFIADLSEDQFKTFSESLAAVAQRSKQSASVRGGGMFMPDPIASADTSATSIPELAKALRANK